MRMWTIETPDDRVDPKLLSEFRGKRRRWHAGAWCAGVVVGEWSVFSLRVGFGGALPPVNCSVFFWLWGAFFWVIATTDWPAAIRRVPSVRRQVLYVAASCVLLSLVQLHPQLPRPAAVAFYVLMTTLAVVSVLDLVMSKS
jgi:hypothetical protein